MLRVDEFDWLRGAKGWPAAGKVARLLHNEFVPPYEITTSR